MKYYSLIFLLLLISCTKIVDFDICDLEQRTQFCPADETTTSFMYKISTKRKVWEQAAYQIIVSDTEKEIKKDIGNCWDSGKTVSNNQLYISYAGKPLQSGQTYYWKVRVWEAGRANKGKWSSIKSFTVPLRYPEDWKARWITWDYEKDDPAPLFRKTFEIKSDKKLVSARLCVSGPGYYEACLNGRKTGDRVLDPAQTNYDDYAFYSVYDIPLSDIRSENVLGIMPGNGWYNQYQVWTSDMAYGQPVIIAQLILNYKDGDTDTICSDETWKWKPGPVVSNNIYAGESYDANLEISGWNMPGIDEKDWHKVKAATIYPPELLEQQMEPIRKMQEIKSLQVFEPEPGMWVFDFGQNFAGWTRLRICGEKGQKITLRFAEEIDSTYHIDPASTGVYATKLVQTDQYTCNGSGIEVWEPRFTYHGFRYVEVTGLKTRPGSDLLTGVVVYSSMKTSGEFSCSEPAINKLHDLALWTIKSNVHGIPTDCPHRERCGWTGDAHVLAPSLITNFNAQKFLIKYMFDIRSSGHNTIRETYFGKSFYDRSIMEKPAGVPTMIAPGKRISGIASPDWGTAVTQIPWQLYLNYGDIDILREFYPDMKTWVNYISEKFPGYIVDHGLGDWCPPGGNKLIDCPVSVSSTAFHYLDLEILKKTADILGYQNESSFYNERLIKVKEQFNKCFYDTLNKTYGSQTANILAIQLKVVPDNRKQDVVNALKDEIIHKTNRFIQAGIFGLSGIFQALADNGEEDLVWDLLVKKGENSFSYMWEKFGATTLWEILPVGNLLESGSLNIRSHSHPMQAGFDQWFFHGIAGIRTDETEVGYKKIIFRPSLIKYLEYAKASYESPYGKISSHWRTDQEIFKWDIVIPPNTSGKIYLPVLNTESQIKINGKIVDPGTLISDPQTSAFMILNYLGSGRYKIEIK